MNAPRALAPRGAIAILDDAVDRLRRRPLVPIAASLATAAPLAALVLVWCQLASSVLPAWVLAHQVTAQQAACVAIALVLPLRHLGHVASVHHAFPEEHPPRIRLGPALATGALRSLALTVGLLFFIVPGLVALAYLALAPALGALDGQYGERALRRSLSLVDQSARTLLAPLAFAYAILFVLVAIDIHLSLPWLLWLVESVAGIELAGLRDALALTHPFYLAALAATSWIALDPLVAITSAEVSIDARMRREGLDMARQLDLLAPAQPHA